MSSSSGWDWLWPGRLAAGKASLLDGDPDQGKSLLTLDWTARLTTGHPMPDGFTPPEPCSVLLLGHEDGLEDTVVPRLRSAGADLTRVHRLEATIDPRGTQRPVSFPRDCDSLRETLVETRARLVIVDPFAAFLDESVSSLNEQMARRALEPLTRIAKGTNATILMVRHLTKRDRAAPALHRGGGAVGIIGLARTAFLVGRDPDHDDVHLLAATKNNLGPLAPTLAYRVQTDPDGYPVIDWLGTSPLLAEEMIIPNGNRYGGTIHRAIAFLQESLADDTRPQPELRREAAALDISFRTLERAKAKLNVQSVLIRENARTTMHWRLPLAPTAEEEQAMLLQRLSNS
jgi:putative DNA primase/helicase